MEVQRAVCIVRNESLLKEVFIVEPTTPVQEFKRMVADKFQHEAEELDLLLQNAICPMQTIDTTLETMSETGVIFDIGARNNIMLLPKKPKSQQNGKVAEVEERRPQRRPRRSAYFFMKKTADYVGLINDANTCYLNSLLQALFMTPEFKNRVIGWQIDEEVEEARLLQELQKLFILLQVSRRTALSTKEFTSSFHWFRPHSRDQQDVQELCSALFDALRLALKKCNQEDLIEKFYEGKTSSQTTCSVCSHKNSVESTFLDLQLPVWNDSPEGHYETLNEVLRGFFSTELLSGSNQVTCEKCAIKTDTYKDLRISQLPYVLHCCLLRFNYDLQNRRANKVNGKITFPVELEVNEFLRDDEGNIPITYELFGAVLHSGTTFAGHYITYVKDFKTDSWYSFNDQKIAQIPVEDLERGYGGLSSNSAYMLIYRRKNTALNEFSVTMEQFSDYSKKLMHECLEENEESVRYTNFYLKPEGQIGIIEKTLLVYEESTLEELVAEVYPEFKEYLNGTPVERCRLVAYNPEQDKVEKQFRDNTFKISDIFEIYFVVKHFLIEICPEKEKPEKNKNLSKHIILKETYVLPQLKTIPDTPNSEVREAKHWVVLIIESKFFNNYSFYGCFVFNMDLLYERNMRKSIIVAFNNFATNKMTLKISPCGDKKKVTLKKLLQEFVEKPKKDNEIVSVSQNQNILQILFKKMDAAKKERNNIIKKKKLNTPFANVQFSFVPLNYEVLVAFVDKCIET